ncbi:MULTISPECIES: MarR family winged helix-turn-helix transcriptional regulator [Eubacterium]|uniref:DNA-binding transcriptional regulator, MarR family n=1 Tax=Eubacterium barkeri TaxID=1528 RepID=A0A1H3I7S5_EUBBA|nr:MarR family transcriptional regulator [Eubacterium barkeri]SDY22994.1 DNA-binding transcriptional regulator, MarR family [Eubacterium barkeri]
MTTRDDEFIITRRVLHLGNLLINSQQDEFDKFSLTFVQAEALFFFDKIKGARAIDLKEHLNISHQAARSIVDRLCKKEYLHRKTSSEDARAKQIYLTPSGQAACDELKQLGLSDGQRLLKQINAKERQQILSLLKKMIANVQ